MRPGLGARSWGAVSLDSPSPERGAGSLCASFPGPSGFQASSAERAQDLAALIGSLPLTGCVIQALSACRRDTRAPDAHSLPALCGSCGGLGRRSQPGEPCRWLTRHRASHVAGTQMGWGLKGSWSLPPDGGLARARAVSPFPFFSFPSFPMPPLSASRWGDFCWQMRGTMAAGACG